MSLSIPAAERTSAAGGRRGTAADPKRAAAERKRTAGAPTQAVILPVAQVAVDVSLAHLDRPFDYLVTAEQSEAAQPGVRVRVRFAGRLVDGFVLARAEGSEHTGKLGFLDRVVSAEPVLAPQIAALARAVADRYAGSLADVLRLAVPPRHARVESVPQPAVPQPAGSKPAAPPTAPPTDPPTAAPPPHPEHSESAVPEPDPAVGRVGWRAYHAGQAFLDAVQAGRPARAVWQALPGEDWAGRLAEAAGAAHAAGRGALLVVPDAADLARVDRALTAVLPRGTHLTLSADLGPAERYRRFLSISRGRVRVVAGTRAAAFAPVAELALLAVFDDGDDLLAEPRAPYPHAREVLMERSVAEGAALLVGGYARTAEAALLVDSGWAREVKAGRDAVRTASPRIEAGGDQFATGADSAAARARLSPAAFAAARRSLDDGAPVLVQVPRAGYQPGLACVGCRRPAQCRHCHGPLAKLAARGVPACRWCGVVEGQFVCGACGHHQLRSTVSGARRTAEELGRAFPGVPLITSAGESVQTTVPAKPVIVVATPGAEPVADGGYGAALLLDGAALLGRADLRASEEALRRWMAAAALVRPARAGGRVVVGADLSLPTVQALIRWDPAGHAAAELAARTELGFPPAVAMASVQGPDAALAEVADQLRGEAEVLGPVPLADLPGGFGGDRDRPGSRLLIRVGQPHRKELAAALSRIAAARAARKDAAGVRIQVDPEELF